MARITYGLITDIRGSIGGLTFQRNASGAIVRLKSTRVINPSNLLANQQRLLASAVALWFTLTNDQKNAWSALALAHPYVDSWNIAKQLNGYQNFLSNNLNLASAGLPFISDAPAYSLPAPPPAFTQNFSSIKYSLSFSAPVDPATPVLLLYATPPVTTSNINTKLAKFIIPVGTWDSGQILDITSSYCTYFNIDLAALLSNSNANICIRAKFIDSVTGFSSVFTSNISHVESVAGTLKLIFDSTAHLASLYSNYADVTFWNTQFNLPVNGNAFTAVTEADGTISLVGGSNITLVNDVITHSQYLTSIDDSDGIITNLGEESLSETGVQSLILDGVLNININALTFMEFLTSIHLGAIISLPFEAIVEDYALESVVLPKCISVAQSGCRGLEMLTNLELPVCTSLGSNALSANSGLVNLNLPAAISIDDSCFADCTSLEVIYLPVCESLGSTVDDNTVFENIAGKNILLTVPAALLTCNGGAPDGDIAYLQANNTVTIESDPV